MKDTQLKRDSLKSKPLFSMYFFLRLIPFWNIKIEIINYVVLMIIYFTLLHDNMNNYQIYPSSFHMMCTSKWPRLRLKIQLFFLNDIFELYVIVSWIRLDIYHAGVENKNYPRSLFYRGVIILYIGLYGYRVLKITNIFTIQIEQLNTMETLHNKLKHWQNNMSTFNINFEKNKIKVL